MSNYNTASNLRNGALNYINRGGSRGIIADKKDIKEEAADNTASVDNSATVNDQIEKDDKSESKSDERRMLWHHLAISLGVVFLLVMALKYKIIKF